MGKMRININKDVIVLGTGISILDLSKKDIDYINSCETVIAINKFMAFYKKAGILPTHAYFLDCYDISNQLFLQYIFNVCRQNNLKDLTFVVDKSLQKRLTTNPIYYLLKRGYWKVRYGSSIKYKLFLIPSGCEFQFINHQHWLKGDRWAHSLAEKLFHFRGSLSTVLNYVSIQFPNRRINLVGVDFNSPKHFFQEDLEKLNFCWQDWTTDIVEREKMHFSAIEYQDSTIFDKFDFMIKNLMESGNEIYSSNPKSLLVEKGFVPYSELT